MTYIPISNKDEPLWSGRHDAEPHDYLFQTIKLINLNEPINVPPGHTLLGFACDEGVKRNQGNPGAKDGPRALRQALACFPLHKELKLYDAGNVVCDTNDLETAQAELGKQVAKLLAKKQSPIIIGGGHETAWGHFQGLKEAHHDLAILNFDAHFDLRPLINHQLGSSGTPFRQIHQHLQSKQLPFHYYCVGIQPLSNTRRLFEYAHQHHVQFQLAEHIHQRPNDFSFIDHIIDQHRCIYLSICLDVFNCAYAPGVSAPQVLGIEPYFVLEAIRRLKQSGKVISLDVVELAPNRDIHDQTAKLAASLIMNYL